MELMIPCWFNHAIYFEFTLGLSLQFFAKELTLEGRFQAGAATTTAPAFGICARPQWPAYWPPPGDFTSSSSQRQPPLKYAPAPVRSLARRRLHRHTNTDTSAQTSPRLGVSASVELGEDGESQSGSAPFEGTLVRSHAWSSREKIEATIGSVAWNGGG